MPDHNTGNSMPYPLRIVCGFLNVPQLFKDCETGPPAYSPYPKRLESLTICWCNYKGSTFYSVISRPWVLFVFFFSCEKVMALKLRTMITRDSYSRLRRKDKWFAKHCEWTVFIGMLLSTHLLFKDSQNKWMITWFDLKLRWLKAN